MGRVVILLGAPGAGKGTQAQRLSKRLGLPHVSTGDLFRENRAGGTELGRRVDEYLQSGKLVPDELVVEMLFERVSREDCSAGYLLDGFPRTLFQAESLAERLPRDWSCDVVNLEVDDEIIVKRAAGRLLCRSCTNIHHADYFPPRTEGRCDACGGELYRREDDEPAVVKKRLVVYRQQTEPVVEFYRRRGLLTAVSGEGTPEEVFERLVQAVGQGVGAEE